MNSIEMDLKHLADAIKDIKFTMLTTVNGNGTIQSRPMATHMLDEKNFDGKLWFFTKKDTAKVHSIERDQHVNLAYANPEKNKYISISGRAQTFNDIKKMQELWRPIYKTWFPEGLSNPDISLISVEVESAEIWDAPPSKIIQLVGYFRARITGRPLDQKVQGQHLDFGRHL